MKRPILILCEIDTEKFPEWQDDMPGAVQSALAEVDLITKQMVMTFAFQKDINHSKAEDWLQTEKFFDNILTTWDDS